MAIHGSGVDGGKALLKNLDALNSFFPFAFLSSTSSKIMLSRIALRSARAYAAQGRLVSRPTVLSRAAHNAAKPPARDAFAPLDTFARRHLGSEPKEVSAMLKQVGVKNMDEMVGKTIPPSIRSPKNLALDHGFPERALLDRLKAIGTKNKVFRSYIGMGYTDTVVPNVILRNVLENPAWYTQVCFGKKKKWACR
jgi:hypothetical protein